MNRHEQMHRELSTNAVVSPLILKKKTAKGIKSKNSYLVAKAQSKDPLPSSIPSASMRSIDHLVNDQQANDQQANDQQANDQQANDQQARNPKASKQYTCSACKLSFASAVNFGRHMLEHEVKCVLCSHVDSGRNLRYKQLSLKVKMKMKVVLGSLNQNKSSFF